MGKELAGVARILGRDQVHLLEDSDRPVGHVLQVPDGRCNDVECP